MVGLVLLLSAQLFGWIFWAVQLRKVGWPLGPAITVAVLWPALFPVFAYWTLGPRS